MISPSKNALCLNVPAQPGLPAVRVVSIEILLWLRAKLTRDKSAQMASGSAQSQAVTNDLQGVRKATQGVRNSSQGVRNNPQGVRNFQPCTNNPNVFNTLPDVPAHTTPIQLKEDCEKEIVIKSRVYPRASAGKPERPCVSAINQKGSEPP
jgi:hypothetical protein